MSEKISNEELIENLLKIKVKLGRVPKRDELLVDSGSKYSMNAYRRAFGNFNNSLIAANLKPNQMRNVSREEIILDLQNVYNQLGHTPSRKEYVVLSNIAYSSPTIKKHIGSWTKLLILADIPVVNAKNVTKGDVDRAIKKWYKENDYDRSCLEYWKIRKAGTSNKFPFSCNTIKKKFGGVSWEDIMKQFDENYETKDPYVCKKESIGIDNNIYLSSLEKEIADFLFNLQEAGKIEKYEYEKLVCDDRKWTCDFYIKVNGKEYWVEADGLGNSRKISYDSGNNEKIIYYKENGYNYFIIDYKRGIKQQVRKIINGKTD